MTESEKKAADLRWDINMLEDQLVDLQIIYEISKANLSMMRAALANKHARLKAARLELNKLMGVA